MKLERVAIISFHGCPLAPLGHGKAGGMNVYVREMARNLGRLGIPVDIFTRRHPAQEGQVVEIVQGVRVVHLDGGPEEEEMGNLHRYLRRFTRNLLRFQASEGLKYSVIHSHYWLSGWVGTHLARRWHIPHVVTFHTLAKVKNQARVGEMEPLYRERAEERIMKAATRVLATSPHERDAIFRLYGAAPEKTAVVPCGVDLSLFHPLDQETAKRELCLGPEELLLYVGRIEPLKNVELLLKTAAIMDDSDGWKVLIVGGESKSGGQVEALKALSKQLGIEKRVKFLGTVSQEVLPLYYNAADICVVPSFYESFSLVALEAMACGTPVVASRVGGLPWVVEHGRTGYLVPWRCPEPFANCLETLLASEALRKSMGQAAQERAKELGWEEVTQKITAIYEEALLEKRTEDR